ncbi:PD-(D/E)XK nuclease family protein [Pseudomonas putida]|uniref:PDDEXK-like family protein n=1 Tax=Pseudomonas putida TaxID=303 RepID=UPI002AC40A5D|nr:PD-(D/E)XK nuclease family protein [Pseudomonas putida]MDZ5109720.1 PD-(D/E)XK nuclease family protein [Pseudomonas putida]
MEKVQRLLDEVGGHVRESIERRTASGEGFNIFQITKIERAEVNTHSAMIAELLNPRGSHGKGARFLEYLLSDMGIEYSCSLRGAEVRKEQSFAADQGRVDIVVHLRDQVILIENKIDAQDGYQQLKKYADAGKESRKVWHLWYLTKDGRDAEEFSHQGVEYRRVSYREHILNWLEQCITLSAETPALQHALIQYRNLVQKITGVSMTNALQSELTKLLSLGENFKHADAIAKALPRAKGAVLFSFFQEIQSGLASTCNRVGAPSEFPGMDATEESCNKWFMSGREKVHHVGLLFDIGLRGMLFRVEVASEALHYGVVSDGRSGSIEMLKKEYPQFPQGLSYRGWKSFQWYSYLHQDNVASNMECLLQPDQLISDVLQTIRQLVTDQSAVCDEVCN